MQAVPAVQAMTQPSGSVLEGWMVGPEAASCSAACSAAGLMCSEGAQMSHNDEIDSDYDMDLVLSSLNQSTCYWHEHAFNSNGNVPSFSPNLSPVRDAHTPHGVAACADLHLARTAPRLHQIYLRLPLTHSKAQLTQQPHADVSSRCVLPHSRAAELVRCGQVVVCHLRPWPPY